VKGIQMSPRFGILLRALIAVVLVSVPLAGQQGPATNWTPSRTAWGDPDLQGVYTFGTNTPLQRPKELGGKATYTESELAQVTAQVTARREAQANRPVDPNRPPGGYNGAVWIGNTGGQVTARTSLIIDPEDGRVPSYSERAQKLRADIDAADAARLIGKQTTFNTWADHSAYTRCVARPIPRGTQAYNHGVQILQSPGQVVIHYESMHDVRVIPLDNRPHIDQKIRLWNGDARGHWEGHTLVVESTNFTDKQRFDATSDGWRGVPQGNMRFTERFTKIDARTVEYVVTVDDPTTYTEPWTFVLPWRGDDPDYQEPEDLYEYACHEGNYRMMEDSLSGSRTLKQATGVK